jgi:hypothetical protein
MTTKSIYPGFGDFEHLLERNSSLKESKEVQDFIRKYGIVAFGENNVFGKKIIYLWSSARTQVLFVDGATGGKILDTQVNPLDKIGAAKILSRINLLKGIDDKLPVDILFPTLVGNPDSPTVVFSANSVLMSGELGLHNQILLNAKTLDVYHSDYKTFEVKVNKDETLELKGDESPPRLSRDSKEKKLRDKNPNEPWPQGWFSDDWLATNDLFHPSYIKPWSVNAVGTVSNQRKKVQLIREYIDNKMTYQKDLISDRTEHFVWSDVLIVNAGMRGQCPEYAVILGSMLRAVGMPTRMVYLIGLRDGGKTFEWGHAVVEYWDFGNKCWVHADALWGVQDTPGHYKKNGTIEDPVTHKRFPINVMEAHLMGHPDDSVCTDLIEVTKRNPNMVSVPDITGDGKLNAWKDWGVHRGAYRNSPYNP